MIVSVPDHDYTVYASPRALALIRSSEYAPEWLCHSIAFDPTQTRTNGSWLCSRCFMFERRRKEGHIFPHREKCPILRRISTEELNRRISSSWMQPEMIYVLGPQESGMELVCENLNATVEDITAIALMAHQAAMHYFD